MLDGETIVEAQFVTYGELPPELSIALARAHARFIPDVRKWATCISVPRYNPMAASG
jgi:hypothetical protein